MNPSDFFTKIIVDPNDNDAYLVYADWLQQQNDPRGEFIALCHRATLTNNQTIEQQIRQHLLKYGEQLLGNLNQVVLDGDLECEWHMGFLASVKINPHRPSGQRILHQLANHPACVFLKHLDLRHTTSLTIPNSLVDLKNLQEVDIRQSSHFVIPETFPQWNLRRLRAEGSKNLVVPHWILSLIYRTEGESLPVLNVSDALTQTEVDEEGYADNMNDWSPALCIAMAQQDDLELSYEHWEIIRFLHEYYEEYQIAPAIRVLAKAVGKTLGKSKGNSKYLYQLFPYGPGKQANRYAGTPKPTC